MASIFIIPTQTLEISLKYVAAHTEGTARRNVSPESRH